MGDGLCGVAPESWGARGRCPVSAPSCPNARQCRCPAPQGSARVSPQHTCPLGMSSQWPRFHGDTEPFPISGMLSTALGWALPPLPFAHGKGAGMGPRAPGGAVLVPFSPRGWGTVPRVPCVSRGCPGTAAGPVLGVMRVFCPVFGARPSRQGWVGGPRQRGRVRDFVAGVEAAGSTTELRDCAQAHGAPTVPVLTVSQAWGGHGRAQFPPPSPWHAVALYPSLHLRAAYHHFPPLAVPGDEFFPPGF